MKYRKKPVVIEATQWFKPGDHLSVGRAGDFFPGTNANAECPQCNYPYWQHGHITTMEGGHTVCPGDWIITGVKGETYACKADIFAVTYEPVLE